MAKGKKKKKKKKTGIVHQLFSGSTFAGNITSGFIVSLVALLLERFVQKAGKHSQTDT